MGRVVSSKPKYFFIGSLPYTKPEDAIGFVKKWASDFPFLPQLPGASPEEEMIGQLLRGMELGKWDEKASSCFEAFFKEFGKSPRVKIQLVGPYTLARSVTKTYDEIHRQWLDFWKKLMTQIETTGFSGELWCQLDEPFWSKKRPIPKEYGSFVCALRGSRKKNQGGDS